MILILGGRSSGKRTYAVSALGISLQAIRTASAQNRDKLIACSCLAEVQNLALPSDAPHEVCDESLLASLADTLANYPVLTYTEVGCGIVPLSHEDRAWREAAGRLGCLLAQRAECVVRMHCGIPQVIKGALPDTGSPA